MPKLRVLNLNNSDISRNTIEYRKHFIFNCKQLTFFDNREVSIEERRIVEAWGKSGKEGEMQERELIKSSKKKNYKVSNFIQEWVEQIKGNED